MKSTNTLKDLEILYDKHIVFCEEMAQCQICLLYSEKDNLGKHAVIRLKSCLHEVCRPCMVKHIETSLTAQIICPIEECSIPILESEMKALCPDDIVEKLYRITIHKALYPKQDFRKPKNTFNNLIQLHNQNVVFCETKILCKICLEEIEPNSKEGQRAIRLRSCLHEICEQCLISYTNNSSEPEVICPIMDCSCPITECELKAICPARSIDRLHNLSIAKAPIMSGEIKLQCYSSNCTGIVIYEGKLTKGLSFKCPVCRKINCASCKAQHPGKSCDEYKFRNRSATDIKNWEASVKHANELIRNGKAMKCPQCEVIIEKSYGCDGLICSMCNLEICWATKGPRWGPRGKGDISGGCRCSPYKRCHPNCNNCH